MAVVWENAIERMGLTAYSPQRPEKLMAGSRKPPVLVALPAFPHKKACEKISQTFCQSPVYLKRMYSTSRAAVTTITARNAFLSRQVYFSWCIFVRPSPPR